MRIIRLFLFVAVSLTAGAAYAESASQTPFDKWTATDVATYKWSPEGKEFNAQTGQRFLDDLAKKDPGVAASVEDAVRYKIQDTEAKKFARQKKFVQAAYGVLWSLIAVFALTVFLRQRKLDAQITELETKLREADAAERARGGAA